MRSKLGDKIRLQHITDAILEIQKYVLDVEFPTFIESSMMRFFCIKQMEIIGKASKHLSNELKSRFPEIQWARLLECATFLHMNILALTLI